MTYDQEPCQKCKPKFDTVIKPSCKKVCQPVTHESCQLVASTECDSVDIRASYKTVDDEYNYFDYHVCEDITVTECHNKTRPKCVTKEAYNCVVGWKMLDDGTKVCCCLGENIVAINHTPHFDVWSALAPTLNFGGVWITAPTLHLLPKKQNISNFVKNSFKK